MTTCSIDGCDQPSAARTWCDMHYVRWLKYGDTAATEHPPHRSLEEGWLRDQFVNSNTQQCITYPPSRFGPEVTHSIDIGGVEAPASEIVCEWGNGPRPDDMECFHLCGNELCVNRKHLAWEVVAS